MVLHAPQYIADQKLAKACAEMGTVVSLTLAVKTLLGGLRAMQPLLLPQPQQPLLLDSPVVGPDFTKCLIAAGIERRTHARAKTLASIAYGMEMLKRAS